MDDSWYEDWKAGMDVKDFIGNYAVSTVRLISDHGWNGDLRGYWYETMVFRAVDGKIVTFGDLHCDRYVTEEQARAGHALWCATVQQGEDEKRTPNEWIIPNTDQASDR